MKALHRLLIIELVLLAVIVAVLIAKLVVRYGLHAGVVALCAPTLIYLGFTVWGREP